MGAGCSGSGSITVQRVWMTAPDGTFDGSYDPHGKGNGKHTVALALLTAIEEAAEVKRGSGLPARSTAASTAAAAAASGNTNAAMEPGGEKSMDGGGPMATGKRPKGPKVGGYVEAHRSVGSTGGLPAGAVGGPNGQGKEMSSDGGPDKPVAAATTAPARHEPEAKTLESDMYETLFWQASGKTYNVLLVGLRGSGKSSLCHVIKSREAKGSYVLPRGAPSRTIVKHPITLMGRKCCLIDTPGGLETRTDLHQLCGIPPAVSPLPLSRIVWVIDSTDMHNLHHARAVVAGLLALAGAQDAPLLIVMNKQDISGAVPAMLMLPLLQLHALNHPVVQVLEVSLTDSTQIGGLVEAILNHTAHRHQSKGQAKRPGKYTGASLAGVVNPNSPQPPGHHHALSMAQLPAGGGGRAGGEPGRNSLVLSRTMTVGGPGAGGPGAGGGRAAAAAGPGGGGGGGGGGMDRDSLVRPSPLAVGAPRMSGGVGGANGGTNGASTPNGASPVTAGAVHLTAAAAALAVGYNVGSGGGGHGTGGANTGGGAPGGGSPGERAMPLHARLASGGGGGVGTSTPPNPLRALLMQQHRDALSRQGITLGGAAGAQHQTAAAALAREKDPVSKQTYSVTNTLAQPRWPPYNPSG